MQILEIKTIDDAVEAMQEIGTTRRGIQIMAEKAMFQVIKLEHVDTRAAGILKQTMLSQGAEAAVSRGTVNLSDAYTDVILMATVAQLRRAIVRLKEQPWGLKAVAAELEDYINHTSAYKF